MKTIISSLAGLLCQTFAIAQTNTHYTLFNIVQMAQTQSSIYRIAATQKLLSHYNYLSFQSDQRPQVSLYGNAPVYSKQYTPVLQPDGSISYLPIRQSTNKAGISLSQPILLTGGSLAINSDFEQFHDFQVSSTSYNSMPIYLQLNQPLFAFNNMKWRRKIEPLKYEQSRRDYAQQMESIGQQAVSYYFDLLQAQVEISTARFNMENDSLNYAIEEKRINLGTTSQNRILQLKLQLLRSRQQLAVAQYDYKIAEMKIKRFIGYKDTSRFAVDIPSAIPDMVISVEKSLTYARRFRAEFIALELKKWEAQKNVAQARASRHQVNLNLTYGLNRGASEINKVYNDLKSRQTLSIGFNIPIIDWGRRDIQYKTAVASAELVRFNNEQDSTGLIEELETLISNIELLKNNITITALADSVATERFAVASDLYRMGKLTILEINSAQSEKDNAKRYFIDALRSYWDAYFLLRKLTLYDFEKQRPLYE